MRYLVTLKPLEPFFFGGDTTFGALGSENSTYLVKSRKFPQQSAILGMLKKEIMTQSKLLTRKVRGEWVDRENKEKATKLVGNEKFDITIKNKQNFGVIKEISPVFLKRNNQKFIKKVAIDKYEYENGLLKNYSPKTDIYDNFISIDNNKCITSRVIFKEIIQVGNKKNGGDDSLYKKTSYILKHNFEFAFYLKVDFELENSIVSLGADGSKFQMKVKESEEIFDYKDNNNYITLLSDAYITIPLDCEFGITSEITHQSLKNKKHSTKHNKFEKTDKVYLYEKGSVFIKPSKEVIENLTNPNLQQIGYNIYSKGETK